MEKMLFRQTLRKKDSTHIIMRMPRKKEKNLRRGRRFKDRGLLLEAPLSY